MELLDWIILLSTLLFIVLYGTFKTRGSKNIQEYILANQSTNWFTVGLSVMATQASAITFLSTPGQAYHDGMGFVQFYFGLPLAMVVICMVFIPVFHRLKVYTAYEFLEERFDLKTRTLASVIFLIQRSIGTGITIYAPAIILSSILNWDLTFILHVFWWNKSIEHHTETASICDNGRNVFNVLYYFVPIARRSKFCKRF